MLRRKEAKIEEERESPFNSYLRFFQPLTRVPVRGLPRRRRAAARGRAAVVHEKRPICRRRLAGCCWRSSGRAGSTVPRSEPLSR